MTDAPAASIAYGVLSQRNPDYDAKRLEEIDDLYKGGYDIMRRADKYLLRFPGESDDRYDHRKKTATYQPYFGQIVDQFSSELLEKKLEITPEADASDKTTPGTDTVDSYYTDFAKDADGQGSSLADITRCLITTALKHQRAVLCVDMPADDASEPAPANKAEEEARGLARAYVYEQALASLIDWETDDDGELLWAICYKSENKRRSPIGNRATTVETFTVWTIGDDGKAEWARYEIASVPPQSPKSEDPVPFVSSGKTSFDRIPLHTLEIPEGLWVGNKIGPQALEHFRRRSSLIGAQNDSLYALPYAALSGEIGAPGGELPAERATNPARGDDPVRQFRAMGAIVIGKEDKLGFAEPTGKCYELVDKQLKELRDDMFAVNHQMAASVRVNTTALGRSGASKKSDKESTSKILGALGLIVRQFWIEVYTCIATARGDGDIRWTAHGLDDYEAEDREQLLEEAISVDQVAIPSPTFRKLHKTVLARRLVPNATSQDFDKIRKEIDAGVDAEQDIRDLEHEARQDELENPPEPKVPVPSVKMPAAKAPQVKTPKPKVAAA